MKDGFIKVAAATNKVVVADCDANTDEIIRIMHEASDKDVDVTVFPELCITGYTCGDLFFQDTLIEKAKESLFRIVKESINLNGLFFVGLPFAVDARLFNVAAAVSGGELLALVPKTYIPNYKEFYEGRYFTSANEVALLWEENGLEETSIRWEGIEGVGSVLVTSNVIFQDKNHPEIRIGAEICEDLWTMNPPSVELAALGATVIVNLSASDELTGKSDYRRQLIKSHSAKLISGYIYASAGEGESTGDVVYSGHDIIAENGTILNEKNYTEGLIVSEIDVKKLLNERRRLNTYVSKRKKDVFTCYFELKDKETVLTRYIDPAPFVPSDDATRSKRCEEIFDIQARGLKKRMLHTNAKTAVIGISGGLDSTLALLVTARAFDLAGKDRKDIIAVTMPGFGTTDRTYDNAVSLIKEIGATFLEISIKDAVEQHFKDIDHDAKNHDVTYENSQARMRTLLLMNLSNKYNGLVIGTGDMSELILGWATYNGDHMSMYGVNASVPKTLVKHLVKYYADTTDNATLRKVIYDVLDTPVSPELLPPKDGRISQKTEELVGPYELHDFVMYYVLRWGMAPKKIFRLAMIAFDGVYDKETILKWMKVFYRRFFSQQFKRSCLPDGPKVGTCAVSPRGDLRMPSDASSALWLKELEEL